MTTLTVAEALRAAAALLSKPGRWTQGAYARTRTGEPIGSLEPKAACWCAYGAIRRTVGRIGSPLVYSTVAALEVHVGSTLTKWNDNPATTQDRVVAVMREAAESLEKAAS